MWTVERALEAQVQLSYYSTPAPAPTVVVLQLHLHLQVQETSSAIGCHLCGHLGPLAKQCKSPNTLLRCGLYIVGNLCFLVLPRFLVQSANLEFLGTHQGASPYLQVGMHSAYQAPGHCGHQGLVISRYIPHMSFTPT